MPRKSSRGENAPKRMYTLIPPQLRERAAVLVLDEGCTISDVADIMNVNRSALSKVVQRARKARALEPPLAATGGDDAAAANANADADMNRAVDVAAQQPPLQAQAKPVGRGKAAINRHKAATSVSFEGMLSFPGPSTLTFFKYLNRTKKSMDICVESITCEDIAKCIVAAKTRGVRVRVITNEQERDAPGSVIQRLVDTGVSVRSHASMRHRFCLLDNMTLLHGSYSWSRSDDAEDLVVRTGGPLITRFRYQFDSLLAAYDPTGSSNTAKRAAVDLLSHHEHTGAITAEASHDEQLEQPGGAKRQRVSTGLSMTTHHEFAQMGAAALGQAIAAAAAAQAAHEQQQFVSMQQQLQQQFPLATMAPAQLLTSLVDEQVLQLPPLPQDMSVPNHHQHQHQQLHHQQLHQQQQLNHQQLSHPGGDESHSLTSESRSGGDDGSDFGRVSDDE